MATKKILTFLVMGAFSFLAGCGGGSSSSGSSSNSQSASVSIALNPAPKATTISVGSTTGIQFTPVVSNDPTKAGVDWAVTCSTPPCGALNITTLHTDSGSTVTYLPPSSFLTGSMTVNVTAFATADHTKNVSTAVTVDSFASVLKGTYILQVTGSDGLSEQYQSTGAFTFDGNGSVTAGEQVLNLGPSNPLSLNSASYAYSLQTASASSGGSSGATSTPQNIYFIGPDGRGTLILNLQQNSNTSSILQETFSITVLSSSQVMIAEIDGFSGSGTLELQNSSAASAIPSGAFAFVVGGTDSGTFTNPNTGVSPNPTSIGGVLNIDNNPGPGSISGNDSLADQDYFNAKGTRAALESCPAGGVTGNVSAPDSMGAVTISLTAATSATGPMCFGIPPTGGHVQFTGFIVDSTHIRLIETDDTDGSKGFLTSGIAVGQGAAMGTFNTASLSGSYVYSVSGFDVSIGLTEPLTLVSAGVVNADGTTGTLTGGVNDTFYASLALGVDFTNSPLSGTYAVDPSGRAVLSLVFKGNPKPRTPLIFYLTGNNTPPLVLWNGGEDLNFPALGTGIAYPQAANPSSLSFGNPETYGVTFAQNLGGAENDGTGRVTSTVTGISGTFTGLGDDFNNGFNTGTPVTISDTFTLPADGFGRFGGTFTHSSGTAGPFVDYFMIDNNHAFFVETDLLTTTQVALGYLAQACDVTSSTSCQAAAAEQSAGRHLRRSSPR